MENIVRPDHHARHLLADALTASNERGTGFRICTGEDQHGKWVKWDAGAGWTPPHYGIVL